MEFDAHSILVFVEKQGLQLLSEIASTLAIFFGGKWGASILVKISRKLMLKAKVDETLVQFLSNMLYSLLLAFVAIAALSQLGIETTSLAAILGAAGLAVGLSLQNSLSNLAAGIMIIVFRPFKKGDYIEAAGTGGVVGEVSIFTTILKTADNKQVIVPNGAIIAGNITNYTSLDTRRIDMTFTVTYCADLKKVKQVLADIIAKEPRILATPEPVIAVSELADSGVKIVVRPWVRSFDYDAARFDITEDVKTHFDEAGILIAQVKGEAESSSEKSKKAA